MKKWQVHLKLSFYIHELKSIDLHIFDTFQRNFVGQFTVNFYIHNSTNNRRHVLARNIQKKRPNSLSLTSHFKIITSFLSLFKITKNFVLLEMKLDKIIWIILDYIFAISQLKIYDIPLNLARFQCPIEYTRLGSRFRVYETSQISGRYSVQMKAAVKQKRLAMLDQMYLSMIEDSKHVWLSVFGHKMLCYTDATAVLRPELSSWHYSINRYDFLIFLQDHDTPCFVKLCNSRVGKRIKNLSWLFKWRSSRRNKLLDWPELSNRRQKGTNIHAFHNTKRYPVKGFNLFKKQSKHRYWGLSSGPET